MSILKNNPVSPSMIPSTAFPVRSGKKRASTDDIRADMMERISFHLYGLIYLQSLERIER